MGEYEAFANPANQTAFRRNKIVCNFLSFKCDVCSLLNLDYLQSEVLSSLFSASIRHVKVEFIEMIVYCDCLNVKIEIQGNDFDKVTLDTLNLNKDELSDDFFLKVSWINSK